MTTVPHAAAPHGPRHQRRLQRRRRLREELLAVAFLLVTLLVTVMLLVLQWLHGPPSASSQAWRLFPHLNGGLL